MHIPHWIRTSRWVSPAKRLEWYPPFHAMGVRVLELSDDWRQAHLLLPLNSFNRNAGGGMFGGAYASLADPIPALSANKIFPGHQLWTRGLKLDYRREGRCDMHLRFAMDAKQEMNIREELVERGRATPTFEYGFYDDKDRLCVLVHNRVAIRPGDYRPG